LINGFVVIDKPAGITSHDVVSRVRRLLGTRKVGHTGTLDPFATGVLPVAVNDGTKAIPFLDEGEKTYQALLRFGVTTDTLDMTGTILSQADPSHLSQELLLNTFTAFTGAITQIPPMYSAIKQNGQPLYKLARQGVEVERKVREVEIHALELLSFALPHASLRVVCSRGTYVRTLADDIGRLLGCGAALQELRRTTSGPFRIEAAVSLTELEQLAGEGRAHEVCVSPLAALSHLPELRLNERGLTQVSFGRALHAGDFELPVGYLPDSGLVRLSSDGILKAVAEFATDPAGAPCVLLKRVFM
jgi:tRNA pseudouridine55 synthase